MLAVRSSTTSLLFLAITFGTLAADGPARPNVVFIFTDDQAQWAMGAYGNREIRTPNLDKLASRGARFTNAFTVTPVCSPSRASMFTSRYSTQFGIRDWINPRLEPNVGLSTAEIGWPELLKANGYATGLFGKWHLGTRDDLHPTRQGYDKFVGFRDGGNTPMNPRLEVDGAIRDLKGSLPDILVDHAIRFVETNRERPFLLSLHFREPHAPYAPSPIEDASPYETLDPTIPSHPGLPVERVKKLTREYYGSVTSVDRNVGRLLDALDAARLTDRTIVIFTSDHGYMIGHHGLHHKGNGTWISSEGKGPRPNMFDLSIKVPLLVVAPGVTKPGSVIDRVVSNLDHFPTILELSGVGVPPTLRIEGKSYSKLLRGDVSAWDDNLFGQYDMLHTKEAHMRMMRTPEWKLIEHLEPGVVSEFYDLKRDPGESVNLFETDSRRADLNRIRSMLLERMASVNDPMTEKLRGRASGR